MKSDFCIFAASIQSSTSQKCSFKLPWIVWNYVTHRYKHLESTVVLGSEITACSLVWLDTKGEATSLALSQRPNAAWPPLLSLSPNWNLERNAIRSAWSDTEMGWLQFLHVCSSCPQSPSTQTSFILQHDHLEMFKWILYDIVVDLFHVQDCQDWNLTVRIPCNCYV